MKLYKENLLHPTFVELSQSHPTVKIEVHGDRVDFTPGLTVVFGLDEQGIVWAR
jgi:hypothetical protein